MYKVTVARTSDGKTSWKETWLAKGNTKSRAEGSVLDALIPEDERHGIYSDVARSKILALPVKLVSK